MNTPYNRECDLKDRLNSFFTQNMKLPSNDYYSNLDADGFLQLKSILHNINNIFTLKVSLSFAHWITKQLELNQEAENQIISQIMETKPNANGYDIQISDPVKLIAEVKCNVPINNGEVYGANQRSSILKDIHSLIRGKYTSQINPNNYLKFMVFLDMPKVKMATTNFVKNMKSESEKIVLVNESTDLRETEKIYVVHVAI